MFEEFDAIIIGSGFCGSLLARKIAESLNKRVLVLERRPHIAGNMYDETDENGVLIQRYGPHTFHTNNPVLFDAIREYSEWQEYQLTCRAVVQGMALPSPFNFDAIDRLYEPERAELLKRELAADFSGQKKASILDLLASENSVIREYAELLFEEDYRPYTAKQWGLQPEDIDPSILRRVPVVFSYADGYFDDKYQYMPSGGFTSLFSRMLDHANIQVKTNIEAMDFLCAEPENARILLGGKETKQLVIFTGAIDQLLDYRHGRLPYRSLRFDYQTHMTDSYQDAPVVAHPKGVEFTRITEFKKIPVQDVKGVTTIAVEYSLPAAGPESEPYYPVLTQSSQEQYESYRNDAEKISNLILCGRLADFKYYNMDNAIERALEVFDYVKAKL